MYSAEDDELSPFFKRVYSEFEFSNTIYNFYIHPQWDDIGSRTLYIKILFADYEDHYAIVELIGEWNDAIENDIQTLKRNIIDILILRKIYKVILIGESVLNFHSDGNDYYQEWFEDIEDYGGWIAAINFPEHTQHDFKNARITHYVHFIEDINWRTLKPEHFFQKIDNQIMKLLDA